eukprot:1965150-Rhodomonas_salina.1
MCIRDRVRERMCARTSERDSPRGAKTPRLQIGTGPSDIYGGALKEADSKGWVGRALPLNHAVGAPEWSGARTGRQIAEQTATRKRRASTAPKAVHLREGGRGREDG